eukprot:scaffold176144_cov47-Prasinocladus_malaysianus.AAC.1
MPVAMISEDKSNFTSTAHGYEEMTMTCWKSDVVGLRSTYQNQPKASTATSVVLAMCLPKSWLL